MATYKLIQDIEADDKLLGPLSFRQFLYALVSAFFLYMSYLLYIHKGGLVDVVTIPIALFTGFLAYPFGKDQPTEVWALAKLRFFLKPRRRIWAQSGIKELVTITVPKKIEIIRTNGLSQNEVQSRLSALANTIDSRGWVVKNADNLYQSPLADNDSDRLVSAYNMPNSVPDDGVSASSDIFDLAANPVAQQVYKMLDAKSSQHRQAIVEELGKMKDESISPSDGGLSAPMSDPEVINTPTEETEVVHTELPPDNEIVSKLKGAYLDTHSSLSNLHTLRSRPEKLASATQRSSAAESSVNPDIINWSRRNDVNINVIDHEINKSKNSDSGNEVVIPLR